MNEQRLLLAEALRRAAEWLEGADLPQPDTVAEYVHLQEFLVGVVKQLDVTGDLSKVTEDLLDNKVVELHEGAFTESEYVEWLKRQIKTAEQNLESRKQAA